MFGPWSRVDRGERTLVSVGWSLERVWVDIVFLYVDGCDLEQPKERETIHIEVFVKPQSLCKEVSSEGSLVSAVDEERRLRRGDTPCRSKHAGIGRIAMLNASSTKGHGQENQENKELERKLVMSSFG